MYEVIGEKVIVLAAFSAGSVTPKAIKWKGRNILVSSVSLSYKEREGSSLNYFFAVETDKGNTLKLKYNNESLLWTIEEAWVE